MKTLKIYKILLLMVILSGCGPVTPDTFYGRNNEIFVFCEPDCPDEGEAMDALDRIALQFQIQTNTNAWEEWTGWKIHFIKEPFVINDRERYGALEYMGRDIWIAPHQCNQLNSTVFDWELGNVVVNEILPRNLRRNEEYKLLYRQETDTMYGYGRNPQEGFENDKCSNPWSL